MIKLPVFILIWAAFMALKVITWLAGHIAIPTMYQWRFKPYNDLQAWTRPWANPEDWMSGPQTYKASLPRWWVEKHGVGFWSWYWYHAWRNGANGLRSFEWLDLDIDPEQVKYVTPKYWRYYAPWELRKFNESTCMYFCWQGWKAGAEIVHLWNDERHLNIKFGWRVQPSDATVGPDPDGIRSQDAGFASKFLVYRKG